MEFSTDIKFSSNLIEGQETTITYSGYLYKNNSTALKIVYGFGDNWMYTQEKDMEKTENGFVATIKMLNFSKFNFCFKNANNEWDNNYNSNFIAPIAEFKVNEEFILNENIIENILTNLVKYDLSEVTAPFEVHCEKNESISIEETIVNVTEESSLNEDLDQEFTEIYETLSDKQDLLDNILSESSDNIVTNDETENFVEEILEPLTLSSNVEENSNIEEISNEEIVDNSNVEIIDSSVQEESSNEEIIDNSNVEANFIEEIEDTSNNNYVSDDIEIEDDFFEDDYKEKIENFQNRIKIENFESDSSNNTLDNIVTDLVDDLYKNSQHIVPDTDESISSTEEYTITEESNSDFQVPEEESSLLDELNSIENDEIEIKSAYISSESNKRTNEETSLIVSPRSLGKMYAFKKKIKLAVYKIFAKLPKILSNNFEEENNK